MKITNINEYIERNIELIDYDLTGFFINAYTDAINSKDLIGIIVTLNKANINSHNARNNAMHYILTRHFEDYQGHSTTVINFIRQNLINYFGFSLQEIEDYIIANRQEFESEYIHIDQEAISGNWMVYVENV